MTSFRFASAAFALAAAVAAVPAMADPIVDAVRDAEYGAVDSTVTFLAGSPNSNFQAPTQFSDAANYTISLASGANSIFGFLQSDRNTGLQFTNLYFGLNGAGSNLGFEIGANGVNAFRPGFAGKVTLDPTLYSTAFSGDGTSIEFSLANSLFLNPIAGLDQATITFPAAGSNIRLNLSQSFSYSVAGGATFGADRLGIVQVGVAPPVPEPATWGMMIIGLGAVGTTLRRRRRTTRVLAAA